VLRHSVVTAALIVLLAFAGYALYTTGWQNGYDEAMNVREGVPGEIAL
jgi:hypothetical protein